MRTTATVMPPLATAEEDSYFVVGRKEADLLDAERRAKLAETKRARAV